MTTTDEYAGIAADPGTEVVCLPNDLDDDHATQVDRLQRAMPEQFNTVERVSGYAPDYQWVTWLPAVLREAGVNVIELDGWATRGRPRTVGPFEPRGVLWHHDASPKGPSPELAHYIALVGRPPEVPAPLAQCWVCMGCNEGHPVGTWHVLAAGRCNHAGEGIGWGSIQPNVGNTQTIGIETDNTVGEKTPDAMLESLIVGTAAILTYLRSDPHEWLAGHKEYAKGLKIDPDDIDMAAARTAVARRMAGEHGGAKEPRTKPFPGVDHFVVGQDDPAVEQLKGWLNDLAKGGTVFKGTKFTPSTRARVRAFQQAHPDLAVDADGIPGPMTWRQLQLDAAQARAAAKKGGKK